MPPAAPPHGAELPEALLDYVWDYGDIEAKEGPYIAPRPGASRGPGGIQKIQIRIKEPPACLHCDKFGAENQSELFNAWKSNLFLSPSQSTVIEIP